MQYIAANCAPPGTSLQPLTLWPCLLLSLLSLSSCMCPERHINTSQLDCIGMKLRAYLFVFFAFLFLSANFYSSRALRVLTICSWRQSRTCSWIHPKLLGLLTKAFSTLTSEVKIRTLPMHR